MEHFFELDVSGGYGLCCHGLKVKVQRSLLRLRGGFFSQIVVDTWNKLPSSVGVALSVNVFKKRLDEWPKMWIVKASASLPLQLQVASYFASERPPAPPMLAFVLQCCVRYKCIHVCIR